MKFVKKTKTRKNGKSGRGVKVTAVVPARNEEKSIGRILAKVRKHVDELIVVDGHSIDRTREIAAKRGAKVILDGGVGKGEALRRGIAAASGGIVLFIDSDGSHDPGDIPKVLAPLLAGKADHVTGSRMLGGSDELHGSVDKFFRLLFTEIITLGINLRFNSHISDSQNGFRAMKTSVARDLHLEENITTIEQEMIIKTLKKGYALVEVPTHEYARWYGNSSISLFKAGPRYLYSWLKYLLF